MSMFSYYVKVYTPPKPTSPQLNQQHNTSKLQPTNTRVPTDTPNTLHCSCRAIANTNRLASTTLSTLLSTARSQNSKAQDDLRGSDQDTEDNQHDDDPGDAGHLDVSDLVGEDFGEVEEDAAALVQDLNARFDLEVFAHTLVEGVQGGLGVPEEFGGVEHVACWGDVLAGGDNIEVSNFMRVRLTKIDINTALEQTAHQRNDLCSAHS
jgi:hypothetical protein